MSAMIWCPFPDEDSAASVASMLLDEKLIACANLLAPMRSMYEWNGERCDAREIGVVFKTHASLLNIAVARIAELHPYETPAVLGWRCDEASPTAASWLQGLVT